MVHIKSKRKTVGYFCSFAVTASILVVLLKIKHAAPFGSYSYLTMDAHDQYYSMLLELIHTIRDFRFPMILWQRGMGVDFLQNMFYYNVSVFNLIALIGGEKYLEEAITLIIILKTATISVSTYYFFMNTKHFYGSVEASQFRVLLSVASAIAFSLSNYVLAYNNNIMWLDCLIIMPLLFVEIERIIAGRNWYHFSLLLTLAIISNFYFSVYICLACVLYFLLQNFDNAKVFFGKMIKCMMGGIVAILCSSVVVLPSANGILSRAKYVSVSTVLNLQKIGNVYDFLASFNPFNGIDYGKDIYTYNGFCGSILLPILVLFLVNKQFSIWYRIKYFLCLLFLSLACNVSSLIYFLHGLNYPHGLGNRYAFILTFLLILVIFENLPLIEKVTLKKGFFSVSLTILYTIFGMILKPQVSFLALLIYLTLYGLLFVFVARNSISFKFTGYAICIIWIVEMASNAIYVSRGKFVECDIVQETMVTLFEDEYNSLQTKLGERKTSFSGRSFVPESETDWYSSVLNGNLLNTYSALGLSHYDSAEVTFRGSTPLSALLFNVKYVLTNEIGMHGGYSDIVFSSKKSDMKLYTNDIETEFGYMLPNSILDWGVTDSVAENQSSLFKYMLDDVKVGEILKTSSAAVIKKSAFCMQEEVLNDSHCEYIANVPISPTLNITYQVLNEEDLYFYAKASSYRHIVAWIDDELCVNSLYTDTASLVHIGKVFPNQTVKISVICGIEEVGLKGTIDYELYAFDNETFSNHLMRILDEPFVLENIGRNSLKGNVLAKDDGILYISIPYSDGFCARVDSKYIKPLKIGSGLMGIPVSAGNHTVIIEYVTPGLMIGTILSIIGILILIMLSINYKSRTNPN